MQHSMVCMLNRQTLLGVHGEQSNNALSVTFTALHGLFSKDFESVLNTRTKRALISLSALHLLTSSTSSLTIETPSTKINGANVVAGLQVA